MPQRFQTAFFAYPAQPNELAETITSGVSNARMISSKISLTLWPEMDIFGTGLADEVRSQIRSSDILVCDITRPNLNVYYEIGYAIGLGKPIAPIFNVSFANAEKDIQSD
jgi:hypothetical protein